MLNFCRICEIREEIGRFGYFPGRSSQVCPSTGHLLGQLYNLNCPVFVAILYQGCIKKQVGQLGLIFLVDWN